MLAILLFLLAVKGTVSLILKKTNIKQYKTSNIVWKSIMMILIFVFVLSPVIIFPQYQLPKVTGEYEVATATDTYIDRNRIEEFSDKGITEVLMWNFGILKTQMEHTLY